VTGDPPVTTEKPEKNVKKRLRQLLEQGALGEIAELAEGRRRVLGLLIALTFDRDRLLGWRAVEALGTAAERIARHDPDAVRDLLRRLYWLMSEESGGICWRSPEAMAEIARRRPDLFSDYAAIVVSLLAEMAEEDLAHFRPGILWAIGRLGPVAQGKLDEVLPAIVACLEHPEPQVRGTAAWCLGQSGRGKLLAARDGLLSDKSPVTLYERGQLVRTSVSELARRFTAPAPAFPSSARSATRRP
jgi:HEAT repeat protein